MKATCFPEFLDPETLQEIAPPVRNMTLYEIVNLKITPLAFSQPCQNYEVKMKKCDLVGRVNMFIASFGDIPENALVKLFNVQCCHFYGSQAWNFCDPSVDSFHKLHNRCVRRLLRLPYATHTRYLPAFTGTAISVERICSRFVKLYLNMTSNDNTIIRTIAKISAATSRSIIGGNLLMITKKYNCQIDSNTGHSIIKPKLTEKDQCTVQAIRDATDIKIDFFNFTLKKTISQINSASIKLT